MGAFWKDCTFQSAVPTFGYELHEGTFFTLTTPALDALANVIEQHYLQPASFREISDGETLAQVLEARLPDRSDTPSAEKDRAGDIGELLGIEWIRHRGDKSWDVGYTLRWKESIRPRRGEDIVAVRWDKTPVWLLKGESKAGKSISSTTVEEARARLDKDGGWPAPFTVDFLAERLSWAGRADDAKRLFAERFKVTPKSTDSGCTHLLFFFSEGSPKAHLETHGKLQVATLHTQIAAILVCGSYETVRDTIHSRAIDLARKRKVP